ncbi:MAG: DUF1761 domain-containing protein [Specibacter sp.]
MITVGIIVSAVVAFVASSSYYALMTPLEQRVLGEAAMDRGRPQTWKVLTELARTAVVAIAFAWIASHTQLGSLPGTLTLGAVLWAGFPLVLLTGSVIWERVPPITAAIHAGDWLIKLLLLAVILGLLH